MFETIVSISLVIIAITLIYIQVYLKKLSEDKALEINNDMEYWNIFLHDKIKKIQENDIKKEKVEFDQLSEVEKDMLRNIPGYDKDDGLKYQKSPFNKD